MGKARGLLLGLILVVAGSLHGQIAPAVHAQSGYGLPCGASVSATPMQGHYTGPWHSDGDYHFLTMGYDINLKVIIDGTLDLTIAPDGHVSGTASGNVDAPIYDQGKKDVSSGYGTISGAVTGVFSPGGSLLVLSHPVISMHWGTFVGGGYTVDRYITMPDYTLTSTAADCVTGSGSIAEKDFPVQNIIADGGGQMSQAPGIGQATGTWTIASDKAAKFADLSAQVDAFIAAAGNALSRTPLTYAQLQSSVLAPLAALIAQVKADPDIARCLLERLGAWEGAAAASLAARASAASPSNLTGYRAEADLLRGAAALGADCSLADGGSSDRLFAAELGALKSALLARSWSDASLLTREALLLRGPAGAPPVQDAIGGALHARLGTISDTPSILEVARVAYVLGDSADSTAAYRKLGTRSAASAPMSAHKSKKKKKKPTATPTRTPTKTPTRTAVPTRTPTATPKPTTAPKTLEQVLSAGVARIDGHATGSAPTLSWTPASGASRYTVTVSAPDGSLLWTWSGSETTVSFGDTSIEGVAGSAGGGWPFSLPASYTWTVTALDPSGTITGLKLR